MTETDSRAVGGTVFLHGLIRRPAMPVVTLELPRSVVVTLLREALSRRIVTGSWRER